MIPKENKFIFLSFLTAAVLIIILHFLYHPLRVLGMDKSLFYLDEQVTLAVFFSVITAFLTGFTGLQIVKDIKDKFLQKLYIGLGVFFTLLSIDEYLELHEYANTLLKLSLKSGTLFSNVSHFSWIFPLSFIVIGVIGMFGLLIIKEKNNSVRYPLIAGLILFIFVLILELAGSASFGQNIYVTFVGLEEGFEMIGTTLFFFAILNKKTEVQLK